MIDLIDTQNVPEIFFDGVEEVKLLDGVARFALFARQNGSGIIVGRFAIPVVALPDVIQAMVMCLTEAAKNGTGK